VAQNQQFGVLAQISPHQHSDQTEQRTHQPIHHRQQQRPTIIHDRNHTKDASQDAASSVQAPQDAAPGGELDRSDEDVCDEQSQHALAFFDGGDFRCGVERGEEILEVAGELDRPAPRCTGRLIRFTPRGVRGGFDWMCPG
jgi:hypothetical protein